ncbi:hypothetical protein C5O80_37550 [Burkholderia sp. SRS-46]|nr:hypothetical protein C5O80_37550 [Burkholderia sp. SRS-46]
MKSLIYAVVAASVFAAPLASFAQANPSVTREQVRAGLAQLRLAGYTGASSDASHYPDDIQAALKRVDAPSATAQAGTASYGPAAIGTSQSGQRRAGTTSTHSVYFRH